MIISLLTYLPLLRDVRPQGKRHEAVHSESDKLTILRRRSQSYQIELDRIRYVHVVLYLLSSGLYSFMHEHPILQC